MKMITPAEAKKTIQENPSCIILDVRNPSEFLEKRINGAILIPSSQIQTRAQSELPDKNATIIVYCHSGRRSTAASQTLTDMGYANVYCLGGITNWPYETVSGEPTSKN